jgi:hypothetical protein
MLSQRLVRNSCWKELQFKSAYSSYFVIIQFKYLSTLSTYSRHYTAITIKRRDFTTGFQHQICNFYKTAK